MNYIAKHNKNFIKTHPIYIGLLVIIFLGIYFKPVFLNFQPDFDQDTINLKGYKEHLSQQNLGTYWNSNILAGIPVFGNLGIEAKISDITRRSINGNMSAMIFYLLLGGMGIYTIFIFYNSHRIIALVSASIFSLSFYLINFFLIGRFDILKFIGFLPWLIFFTLYLKNRRSILASGLLSLTLILAIKDPVPGLIISVLILTVLLGIFSFIRSLFKREFKFFLIFSILLMVSYIIALSAISYPAFYLMKLQNLTSGYLTGISLINVLLIYGNLLFIFLWGSFIQLGLDNINNDDTNYYSLIRSVITGSSLLLILLVILRFFFDLIFISDTFLIILITMILSGIIILLLRHKKITLTIFLLLYLLFSLTCLYLCCKRDLDNLADDTSLPKLPELTIADEYFARDPESFRIYPLGNEFNKNSWGIHNQTIGGNYDYRLYRYNRVLDKCLNTELQNRVPINWNIVNMLNVKYLIYKEKISVDALEYAFYDLDKKNIIYKNINYLPRAWFVNKIEYLENESDILKRLNSGDFDPSDTAIVENDLKNIGGSLNSEIIIDSTNSDLLQFTAKTDTTSFLLISEIYYPSNWKAYLNGSEIPIYPANFTLRGVVIPAGEYKLIMKYEPEKLPILLNLNLIAVILTFILIFIGIFQYIRRNYKGEIVYVIKR